MPTKSNNTGGRGGARPGAGRKKSAVKDKAENGNPGGRKLEVLDIPEVEGVDMPKPHDFLSAEQRDGSVLQAQEIYMETWKWLKGIGCAAKVSPQLLERYAMCSARWVQCEEMTNRMGFLSKHPTTGKPIPSPYTVRRLTPTECARLQGFPDSWCADLGTDKPTDEERYFWHKVFKTYAAVTGCKMKSDKQVAKWLKDPYSDSAEYKMWGNGVALPCVWFVLCGIVWYTAYIEIPKKQGKSELAAAVALLLTCGDGEERAEVYGCAADRQQASIVFNVAADMVRMCPALSKRVKILDSQKRLIYQPTGSIYQVLSADVGNKHGFNTHGVVFDELHTQPNRKLFDVMTKGSGDARMQPLYFLITTAGNDTKSICYEIHQKAQDIIAGRKVDHTFYPVIYGAEESDDWTDPAVWKKANPSLGITVGIDKVKDACESAKQNPGEENSFRQLRLNQWVKQAVRWMPMEKWDKCEFAVSEDDLEGRVCYGGLDLSSTTDITAFVLVFPPEDENDKYIILPYFWIPEDNLDLRVRRDHVPYDVWERQGFLQTTEGNVVHYGYIEKFIESLGERFNIREIAFDRWGAVQMVQNLEGMGFTVVPFGQGFKDMSPPTKELMKLVLEQRIAHGGHPVLRWMMDNIFIRTDPAGNIKPDKEKSTEKIDGAVATIMALDRAIRCGNDNGASVYDSRGLLFI